MKKVSNLELEKLVDNLINKLNDDQFTPNFIVETGNSAHYLALQFSDYFSIDIIKLIGKRCNSNNLFLSVSYSFARKIKKVLFKTVGSSNNYTLNILRGLVLRIYEKNYPQTVSLCSHPAPGGTDQLSC